MKFEERLVVSTGECDWRHDSESGAKHKLLDELTRLVRLGPGGELLFRNSLGEEGFVLAGSASIEVHELVASTHFRFPSESVASIRSESGCTLLLKSQPFTAGDTELVLRRTGETPWLPGQGRLEVMPLHEHQGRSTAPVKWPAGERFVPHRHWGGEEIFVLSGAFMDEHGTYPTGTWIRSPHLSQHHPFVEQETTILVKVGHLG